MLSRTDARKIVRIAEVLRNTKADDLKVVNAIRQLQQLSTKIKKKL